MTISKLDPRTYLEGLVMPPRTVALTMRPTSRGKIIGHDARLRHALSTIDRVSRSSCTVLVTGESGTGKELLVAALHDASPRRERPLVTVNCGAIASELVESELFGHVKGAFTGAQTTRRGLVAAAEGGTLFLDEIGDLPLSAQVKLLRVLQQREYTPVGDTQAVRCDVRIAAATHRDLEKEVAAGRFRADLYHRLNVIEIHVPPLRERGGDVALLAEHFFAQAVARSGRTDLLGLAPETVAEIRRNPWLGNVRALENAVERGVLLSPGPWVSPEELLPTRHEPAAAPSSSVQLRPSREPAANESGMYPAVAFPRDLPESGVSLFEAAEAYQNELIRQALARTGGNKNRAAKLLGVNRTTLVEMIRRRGLAA